MFAAVRPRGVLLEKGLGRLRTHPGCAAFIIQATVGKTSTGGNKLSPKENESYKRTDEVLHDMWNPIGVAGCPGARDEYYAYLPRVFSLLIDRADAEAIADYLVAVEAEHMGVDGRRDQALNIARLLIDDRDWVLNHPS